MTDDEIRAAIDAARERMAAELEAFKAHVNRVLGEPVTVKVGYVYDDGSCKTQQKAV